MKAFVLISNSKYSEVISLSDILFIQADGSYSKVIMKNCKLFVVSKNLTAIENAFQYEYFLRIHRSYIVNINHISKIFNSEDKIELGEIVIPVSRDKKKILREKLSSFIQII